jgi:competence protein CoiA
VEFSLVDGVRTTAAPKLTGTCPACGGPTRAKCGQRIVWHWAHQSLQHCDPWWEHETPWHRAWKASFPEDWREQVLHDSVSGAKHVADVRTDTGLVIEFQNSPMSLEERDQRERFYKNMIWIVNAQTFASNFHILDPLPPPDAEIVRDLVFFPAQVDTRFPGFWRRRRRARLHPRINGAAISASAAVPWCRRRRMSTPRPPQALGPQAQCWRY